MLLFIWGVFIVGGAAGGTVYGPTIPYLPEFQSEDACTEWLNDALIKHTLVLGGTVKAYCMPAGHEAPNTWHLLTRSRAGTVSLLKSLTKAECEFTRKRLLGLPATVEEERTKAAHDKELRDKVIDFCKAHAGGAGSVNPAVQATCDKDGSPNNWSWPGGVTQGSDIEYAECFQ